MSAPIKLDFKKAPDKNIAFLQEKGISLTFDYKEIQKEAHQKAFTVAKIMKLDVLADIQNSLVSAQKEGKSFKKWKKEIAPLLQKKGWWGEKEVLNPKTGEIKTTYIGSRRLRTIFETNMRTAHAVGRANNIYNSTNEYIQYIAILDWKTRPDHASLNGIVKHKNDIFWKNYFPPNGWGCRCYVISLSKKDLERKGLKVDTKEYKKFADNDFAYDLRFLDKEALENTYYNKAIKLAKNCIEPNAKGVICGSSKKIVQNAIEYIYSQERIKNYKNFVDEVSKDVKYHKDIVTAGAIAFEVFEFLKAKEIVPKTPHIYLSKKSLVHMTREAKTKRDQVLSLEEIRNIPNILNNPKEILYDTEHKNIIYVYDSLDDKENKIVLEINYKYKKEDLNMIVTTGKVKSENLKEKRYIKIK
ncbi:MAG: hypothetical protein C0625_15390 [Arcobacter sp.]|nr:MAG: hypothetical protein C0625_15390 [Arcobacter sp.]